MAWLTVAEERTFTCGPYPGNNGKWYTYAKLATLPNALSKNLLRIPLHQIYEEQLHVLASKTQPSASSVFPLQQNKQLFDYTPPYASPPSSSSPPRSSPDATKSTHPLEYPRQLKGVSAVQKEAQYVVEMFSTSVTASVRQRHF